MLRVVLLLACAAACSAHAVVPVVQAVPFVASHVVPAPYLHGYSGHGLLEHGYAKPLVHHLLKRSPSPHLVGHVAPVAPVAVSHQSRVDVHSAPAIVPALPVVKPVAYPVLHTAPLLHKSVVGPYAGPYLGPYAAGYHGGIGHYGTLNPHLGYY